jgi:FkbM family methyltransferase
MNQLTKFIKITIFKVFGQLGYLKLLNITFFTAYKLNFLKNNPTYKYHYFSKNLIKPGDTVVDIGANLGDYSVLFRQWIGASGKLYSVEPVPVYNKILNWRLKKYSNVIIFPYALGLEEKNVMLVTPGQHGYLRTGLPFVFDADNEKSLDTFEFKFEAKMKKASELLKDIPKIDFIKCDIEGYEEFVIPEMKNILIKHKPILQIETTGNHKKVVESVLFEIGYKKYELEDGILRNAESITKIEFGDFIYIHPSNTTILKELGELYKA